MKRFAIQYRENDSALFADTLITRGDDRIGEDIETPPVGHRVLFLSAYNQEFYEKHSSGSCTPVPYDKASALILWLTVGSKQLGYNIK